MPTILKMCIIIFCIVAVRSQDNDAEIIPEAIPAVQAIDNPIIAQQNSPQPAKQEEAIIIEAAPKTQQKTNSNQELKVPISVQDQPSSSNEDVKTESIADVSEVKIDDTPNTNMEEATILQNGANQAKQDKIIEQQSSGTNPENASTFNQEQEKDIGSLQNLTEQQQKQMLLQQSLRTQLHENKQLNLADLANLTPEQQKRMSQRFAEEAKLAYEKSMRQMADRQAKQRLQMEQLLKQTRLSYSQKIKGQERLKKMEFVKRSAKGFQKDSSQVMFQLDPFAEQDFLLTLLVQQDIAFVVSIYSNENGVYTRKQNIENEKPMQISIYQNYNRLIYQDSFHFTNAYSFKGEPHSTYTIRFQNSDIHRLVSAKISNVLSNSNIISAIKTQEVTIHAQKTNQLWISLRNRFKQVATSGTIQLSNKRQLRERIQYYFYYNIAELCIFAIVVFVQIKLIKHLLNRSSVV